MKNLTQAALLVFGLIIFLMGLHYAAPTADTVYFDYPRVVTLDEVVYDNIDHIQLIKDDTNYKMIIPIVIGIAMMVFGFSAEEEDDVEQLEN